MNGLDATPAPPTFMEPQFIFGLILVFSWLIFMAVALSLYHTDMNTAITAMERISALLVQRWALCGDSILEQRIVNS